MASLRIFVAGASGVVGMPLCRMLLDDGMYVIGMTRPRPDSRHADALRKIGVEPVMVDVFDKERLLEAVTQAKPDVIIHQLTDLPDGLDPKLMPEARSRNARIRREGTANLVNAARAAGVKRVIAQSLAFVYAPGPLPWTEDAPLNIDDPVTGESARAVASLEEQILSGPYEGVVLRYGKFYGPGTRFDSPPPGGPLHVHAAADAARKAVTRGRAGVYNIAEDDGTVSIARARSELSWDPTFRYERL
ncbi:MAG: NAD(P)-dependent oxidoreductase [Bacteroidota bacterium]|jgi:nucleoside-diphosphate-sugar epimerase|nr:MAG: dTDP-glucose 4,6-dehydratase [Bacteroidota bacterium]